MEKLLYLVPVCGLVALLFALFTARYIGKKDAGTAKMKDCLLYTSDAADD